MVLLPLLEVFLHASPLPAWRRTRQCAKRGTGCKEENGRDSGGIDRVISDKVISKWPRTAAVSKDRILKNISAIPIFLIVSTNIQSQESMKGLAPSEHSPDQPDLRRLSRSDRIDMISELRRPISAYRQLEEHRDPADYRRLSIFGI